jgi:hypothetical protein
MPVATMALAYSLVVLMQPLATTMLQQVAMMHHVCSQVVLMF